MLPEALMLLSGFIPAGFNAMHIASATLLRVPACATGCFLMSPANSISQGLFAADKL